MKIRAGYDIAFNCIQEVPMLLMLSVHPSRQQDLLSDHVIRFSPNVEARDCLDAFGNVCTRLVAPPGLIELSNEFLISDSGLPDEINNHAEQWPVGDLPDEALPYLLGSRYCDTEKLSDQAWAMFGGIAGGWQRVQAICDLNFRVWSPDRPDGFRDRIAIRDEPPRAQIALSGRAFRGHVGGQGCMPPANPFTAQSRNRRVEITGTRERFPHVLDRWPRKNRADLQALLMPEEGLEPRHADYDSAALWLYSRV